MFTAFVVSSGITADVEKGIIDRFRSLPIRRSAVLIGRSVASLLHSSIGVVVMAVTGLCIGWRIRGSVGEAVLAFALILVFGFGMIWFGILVGSLMRSVEAVNGVMFTVLFPITFLVTRSRRRNPCRAGCGWSRSGTRCRRWRRRCASCGATVPAPPDAQLPLHHPVLATILWSLAITAVIAPFALRAYARHLGLTLTLSEFIWLCSAAWPRTYRPASPITPPCGRCAAARLPPAVIDADWLRQVCLDAGADDAAFATIDDPALESEREHADAALPGRAASSRWWSR